MLNMIFKKTKILYPALEDFDVDIEKITDKTNYNTALAFA